MKRSMMMAVILLVGIFAVTASGTAMAVAKKGPVGKVVNATVDTTKKVGTVTGDAVGKVSETAATATKTVSEATGDAVQTVSDTAIKGTEGTVEVTGDAVQKVTDSTEKVATDIFKK